jgi:biotin carboxyl carrier protein
VKCEVTIDGKPGVLLLSGDNGRLEFSLEDLSGTAELVEVEPGIFSVLVGARSVEVKIGPHPAGSASPGFWVDIDGIRRTVEVRDPRDGAAHRAAAHAGGRLNVSAPMPGKVIRVLVAEGDHADAGAGLVVVEAMKMQNEMKAPRAGRVAAVRAREGATVASGEVLVVLE